jgi:alanine dehydrogenase
MISNLIKNFNRKEVIEEVNVGTYLTFKSSTPMTITPNYTNSGITLQYSLDAKTWNNIGAKVTILDVNLSRLRHLAEIMPANVTTLMSNHYNICSAIATADLVVGAVLIPGAKAPHLITRDMLKLMQPGTVLVDVAVDQGGCIETCTPTTHLNPTFIIDGIIHYCVANMPGAVPYTSTLALTNVL